MVKKIDLHRFLDKARVRAALDAGEALTTAPIHVTIAPFFLGSVKRIAARATHHHRLAQSQDRNGVVFFIVPSRRRFAVIGDVRAHEALGQERWDAIAALVQQHFAAGDPTAGLVAGIEAASVALSAHWPR